jgi:hypothetical protein
MRVLIFLLALLVLLALVGWITFTYGPGRASVNLETEEIRQDTGEALQRGSELLQEAEEEVSPRDERATAESPPPRP